MPQQTLRDKAGFSQLSYTIEGIGPVIMLLHGFPDNGALWRLVAPQLAGQYTVVCPDLPGTGSSALPEDGKLTIERMANAVAAVADEVSAEPFILIGHSMGGYTALAFAEKYGGRLKGLTLVHSTAAADDAEKQAQRQKAIVLIQKGGKDAFMKDAVPKMFSTRTRDDNPDLVRALIDRGLQLPDASAIAYYEAMKARPGRMDMLRRATIPVQWILGKDDPLIPIDKATEQSHLAGCSALSVYQNCGHLSMLEAPERLAEDLREFAAYCYKA